MVVAVMVVVVVISYYVRENQNNTLYVHSCRVRMLTEFLCDNCCSFA